MATPQDAPTRKKQKARAARKLEQWRSKKQEEQGSATKSAPKKAKK